MIDKHLLTGNILHIRMQPKLFFDPIQCKIQIISNPQSQSQRCDSATDASAKFPAVTPYDANKHHRGYNKVRKG